MGDSVKEFVVAAGANMTSGAVFNCFDVCRMRLHIQDGLGQAGSYCGMQHTMVKIIQEEGLLAPWSPGIGATMVHVVMGRRVIQTRLSIFICINTINTIY
jgi:hypothetical protein